MCNDKLPGRNFVKPGMNSHKRMILKKQAHAEEKGGAEVLLKGVFKLRFSFIAPVSPKLKLSPP